MATTVEDALGALDQLTRQNFVMIKDNRASATELRRQSNDIARTVSVFRPVM